METERKKIDVFLIEDSEDDYALLSRSLAKEDAVFFEVKRAESLASGLSRLRLEPHDIILADLNLPDCSGLDTFTKIHTNFPNDPIVVLSGLSNENIALQAMHEGAQDYVIKGQISGKGLVRVIRYAIERHQLVARLEKSLKEIKALRGLLPICAWCKNIRDDKGYWKKVEAYLSENTDVVFTHGICPECAEKLRSQQLKQTEK